MKRSVTIEEAARVAAEEMEREGYLVVSQILRDMMGKINRMEFAVREYFGSYARSMDGRKSCRACGAWAPVGAIGGQAIQHKNWCAIHQIIPGGENGH